MNHTIRDTFPANTGDVKAALKDDVEAAVMIRHLWQAAKLESSWPANTDTAVALLRAGGFDADARLLNGWAKKQLIEGVTLDRGEWQWKPSQILAACVRCDAYRRWIPLHSAHTFKMSGPEIADAQARLDGGSAFDDLDTLSVHEIAVVLARMDDPNMREVFRVGLMAKLRQMGVSDL